MSEALVYHYSLQTLVHEPRMQSEWENEMSGISEHEEVRIDCKGLSDDSVITLGIAERLDLADRPPF
jgi:hypothetical protein